MACTSQTRQSTLWHYVLAVHEQFLSLLHSRIRAQKNEAVGVYAVQLGLPGLIQREQRFHLCRNHALCTMRPGAGTPVWQPMSTPWPQRLA
jgi:hypothetical protein